MRRDTHRRASYDAEAAAYDGTAFEVPVGLYALAKLSLGVSRSRWWARAHGGAGPRLRETRPDATHSWASVPRNEIRFCRHGDTVATLGHELAHLVAPDDRHGPLFRRAQLDLMSMLAGPSAAAALDASFHRARLAVAERPSSWAEPADCGPGGLLAACDDAVVAAPEGTLRHAERVNKLLAKAASSTSPAEAEALQAKAVELTVRHGIDAALLDAARGDASIVERRVWLGAGPYVAARTDLLTALGRHLSCEVFWHAGREGRLVTVVGFSSDAADVLSLFGALDHAALSGAWAATLSGNTQAARRQWLFGFNEGVREQLRAAAEANGLDEPTNPAALVLVERRRAVDEHVARHHSVRRARRATVVAADAYDAGRAAGATAALRAPTGRPRLGLGR